MFSWIRLVCTYLETTRSNHVHPWSTKYLSRRLGIGFFHGHTDKIFHSHGQNTYPRTIPKPIPVAKTCNATLHSVTQPTKELCHATVTHIRCTGELPRENLAESPSAPVFETHRAVFTGSAPTLALSHCERLSLEYVLDANRDTFGTSSESCGPLSRTKIRGVWG